MEANVLGEQHTTYNKARARSNIWVDMLFSEKDSAKCAPDGWQWKHAAPGPDSSSSNRDRMWQLLNAWKVSIDPIKSQSCVNISWWFDTGRVLSIFKRPPDGLYEKIKIERVFPVSPDSCVANVKLSAKLSSINIIPQWLAAWTQTSAPWFNLSRRRSVETYQLSRGRIPRP